MPTDCVVSLDNVLTVQEALFIEPICRLSGERMRQVRRAHAPAIATGCDRP